MFTSKMLRMLKADYICMAVGQSVLLKNIQYYINAGNWCSPEGACFKIKVNLCALSEYSRLTVLIHAVDSCLFISEPCFGNRFRSHLI